MRSWAIALACIALFAPLVGCMGDDERALEAATLPRLVLQPEDVGEAFAQFDQGRLGRADFQPGPRQDIGRFGRIDGWKARYRLAETGTPPGPLVIVSTVDLFDDGDGAEQDLDAYRREFEHARAAATSVGATLAVPTIGDETAGASLEQADVFYYTIAWSFENATASVLVQGFELSVDDAVALARKQQRRIAAAMRD